MRTARGTRAGRRSRGWWCSAVISGVALERGACAALTLCRSSGRPAAKMVLPSSELIRVAISGQNTEARKLKRSDSSSAVSSKGPYVLTSARILLYSAARGVDSGSLLKGLSAWGVAGVIGATGVGGWMSADAVMV